MIQEHGGCTNAAWCGREIDTSYRYSLRENFHMFWRCYSKIIISGVLGRSEVSSRLPQGLKNSLHVFGSARSEEVQ
ncbi:hypothetical protein BS78_09G219300 [Paspalum vaginatum]|nr:hypothetical protein BS78_09G219300 [Paspalum vaginatum]